MKTIFAALTDEVHYPLNNGFVENRLIMRELNGDGEFTFDVAKSNAFRGAVADCLISLITAPNFSEADISISMQDRDLILKRANSIYTSIGEDDSVLPAEDEPKVYIMS
jgi:hypothetical protein